MLDTQPTSESTSPMGAYRNRENFMASNGKVENLGPNWSEFTAAINAQRADFKEMLSEIRDEMKNMSSNLLSNTEQSKEWVKALKDNSDAADKAMKEDMLEKFVLLNNRINVFTGFAVASALLGLGALIAFVADVLKTSIIK